MIAFSGRICRSSTDRGVCQQLYIRVLRRFTLTAKMGHETFGCDIKRPIGLKLCPLQLLLPHKLLHLGLGYTKCLRCASHTEINNSITRDFIFWATCLAFLSLSGALGNGRTNSRVGRLDSGIGGSTPGLSARSRGWSLDPEIRPVNPRIHGVLRVLLHLAPGVEGCTLGNGCSVPRNRGVNPGIGGVDPGVGGIALGMMASFWGSWRQSVEPWRRSVEWWRGSVGFSGGSRERRREKHA